MEITLRHSSPADRDVAIQGSSKAVNDAAFHLSFHAVRVHREAGVNCTDGPARPHLAFRNLNLYDLRDDGAEGAVYCNAAPPVVGQCCAPVRFAGRQIEDFLESRRAFQESVTIVIRVLPGCERDLVDK